jgi:formate dehydrogenase subunit delta
MHIDYLVRMANDIGDFFANEADKNVAATSIHQHIHRYWDPRMRSRIVAHFNETGGNDLEGPVRTAIQRLAEETAAKA